MKTRIVLLICFVFLTKLITEAQVIHDQYTLLGTATSIAKNLTKTYHKTQKYFISETDFWSYSSYSIGRFFPSVSVADTTVDSTAIISRSSFNFSWTTSNIPANATITKVTVNFSNSTCSYTFKITQLTSLSGDKGADWQAIGNGSVKHRELLTAVHHLIHHL